MSDFPLRSSYMWLVAMVIFVPLVFSVVWVVVEYFLPFECYDKQRTTEKSTWTRNSFELTTSRESIKVALYNVGTTILLLVFSGR